MRDSPHDYWNTRDAAMFEQNTKEFGRAEAIERMVELYGKLNQDESAVTLDLGCGTGLFAKLLNNQNIVGIDFSARLLKLASERMTNTLQASIFDYLKKDNSVDNIISLFVIDDYPGNKKTLFFNNVFSTLKPQGHFFFSSYSPNDERMGSLKTYMNEKIGNEFTIHLESVEYYVRLLQKIGFEILKIEKLKTIGQYLSQDNPINMKREFDLIIAAKP